MIVPYLALVESNTTGTGRLFARATARLGFRPILLTADPNRYRYVAADRLDVLCVNTQEEALVLNACRRLATQRGLVGVTSSSEYFVATAANVAHELGLPAPSPGPVLMCRNKNMQRTRLREMGIGVPEFRLVSSEEEGIEAARCFGFPVVTKPVSGTGSTGVKLCEHAEGLSIHASMLLREQCVERGVPVSGQLLVEQFVAGPEYSVETFGKRIVGITQKHLGALPYFVEVGHDFPAQLPSGDEQVLREVALRALEALELGWGPAHLEVRVTSDGPKIIEVNPRLAGGYIPELVRLASGLDLVSETIRVVAGVEPQMGGTRNEHASIRFLLPPTPGTLLRVRGVRLAEQVAGVVDVLLYVRRGARLQYRGDFRDRAGHVIACGISPSEVHSAADHAHQKIQFFVKPELPPREEEV